MVAFDMEFLLSCSTRYLTSEISSSALEGKFHTHVLFSIKGTLI